MSLSIKHNLDCRELADIAFMRTVDNRFNEVAEIVIARAYSDWSEFFACSWQSVGRGDAAVRHIKKFAQWAFSPPVDYVSFELLSGERG